MKTMWWLRANQISGKPLAEVTNLSKLAQVENSGIGRPHQRKVPEHAHTLFRARRELDGGPYRFARDRRAVRGPADFIGQARAAGAHVSRDQPGGQGPYPSDRWAPADRSGGHSLLPGQTLSAGGLVAARRWGRRGAGHLVDVVHRLEPPSGAPARAGGCEKSVWARRSEIGGTRMGAGALFDRRHPSVPALLALCSFGEAGTRNVPAPVRPLRPHDVAAGSA